MPRSDRLKQRHHRHHHHDAAQEGHPPLLDAGADAARRLGPAHHRPGLHHALHPGARGPGDAGKLGEADLDPRRDRGHAGRLHRGRRRHGRHHRRHLRRHPHHAHDASATSRRWSPTASSATRPACWRRSCRSGAPASPRRLRSTASPSSAGTSRSPAAAARSFPGDVIVCDDDGAVVIPQNLLAFVADEGAEHERLESYMVRRSRRARSSPASIRRMTRPRRATRPGRKTSSVAGELKVPLHCHSAVKELSPAWIRAQGRPM